MKPVSQKPRNSIPAPVRKLAYNWPPKVAAVVAAVVLFFLYDMSRQEERVFSVPLEVSIPEGLVVASAPPERVRVTLSGEREQLAGILEEDIRAYLDGSAGVEEGVTVAVVDLDGMGTAHDIEELETRVVPATVMLTFERKIRKEVNIDAEFSGAPPAGYLLGQYRLSPETASVEGPSSLVDSVTSVTTARIDLSGRVRDFDVPTRLYAPNGLVILPDVIEFHGDIEETSILSTFTSVETVVLDLPRYLVVTTSLPTGSVRVQGGRADLEGTKLNEVQLTADASQVIEAGTYTLQLRPTVPPDLVVLQFEPLFVKITVTQLAPDLPEINTP